jgi:glucose/galactose transporter
LSARYESFIVVLVASVVRGAANTILQASVNPYVTICGDIESAARRISIMGTVNKIAWSVTPVLFAWIIGKAINHVSLADLYFPFYVIIGIFVVLGILTLVAPIPEVTAVGEDEQNDDTTVYATNKTSIWQFPHLWLGALALFIYVGVETVALVTIVDYAKELGLSNPEGYSWISTIGMVVGYLAGILLIPKYLSQEKSLVICSIISILGSLSVVLMPAVYSIWGIGLIALGCSLMWPALWPLAIMDLGRFTKSGSSLLVMAIVGGGVFPILYGALKDVFSEQSAYWMCLPCFLFILYYAVAGCKIRKS